jgi:hypothetical protein
MNRSAGSDDGGTIHSRQAIQPLSHASGRGAPGSAGSFAISAARSKATARVKTAFEIALARASQIRSRRKRGYMLYSFHAPETECIGRQGFSP